MVLFTNITYVILFNNSNVCTVNKNFFLINFGKIEIKHNLIFYFKKIYIIQTKINNRIIKVF